MATAISGIYAPVSCFDDVPALGQILMAMQPDTESPFNRR